MMSKFLMILLVALLTACGGGEENSSASVSASQRAEQMKMAFASSDITCRRDDYDPERQ